LTSRDIAEISNELRPGFESARLKPPSIAIIPFQEAIGAYERVANGHATAKQVLAIS
jgi:hypothetical protein